MEPLFAPGRRTRLMAVINVSPESFYQGSVRHGHDAVAKAAHYAEHCGAAMIDIGAMSTAPYKETWVEPEEEARRLCDGIKAVRSVTNLPISADTQRAAVAEAALAAGAQIVNDISGLRADPAMAGLVARRRAGVILMANERSDFDEAGRDPAGIVEMMLREALARAEAAGIPRGLTMLDPGFGFFRHRSIAWDQFDIALLRSLPKLRALGYSLLVGVSRKSFFAKVLGRNDPSDRLAGSLATAAWCALQGVEWLRVHDVAESCDVLRMMEILGDSGPAKV